MELEKKDSELWKAAERRTVFKNHVLIYFIMNIIFWTIWYLSLKNNPSAQIKIDTIPWPVWPMVGWGIGLLINYFYAYKGNKTAAEKEYQKLKNKQ